ncbi:YVTN repeat/Quino protein amine dehydrogenase [Salix suchowensis]|nr:YVTN repeat/Quino protein amine dehydrogenase [Salix suchowensis]
MGVALAQSTPEDLRVVTCDHQNVGSMPTVVQALPWYRFAIKNLSAEEDTYASFRCATSQQHRSLSTGDVKPEPLGPVLAGPWPSGYYRSESAAPRRAGFGIDVGLQYSISVPLARRCFGLKIELDHRHSLHDIAMNPNQRPQLVLQPSVSTTRGDEEMQEEEETVGGSGWRMLRHDEDQENVKTVNLTEAVERYGKKRSHGSDNMMEGVETTSEFEIGNPAPPRKKARASGLAPISTVNAAAPPSPLPSPMGPYSRKHLAISSP